MRWLLVSQSNLYFPGSMISDKILPIDPLGVSMPRIAASVGAMSFTLIGS
jgi:hypothetical protein